MSKYMQKYSIIIFKSKIDIRKKSLYQEKELGEDAEAHSHLCSAASQQMCFECIFLQKFLLKLNPFLWGVRKLDILLKLQHLTAKFCLIKSRIFSLKKTHIFAKKMQNPSLRSITYPASDLIFSYNCSIFHLLISTLLPF